MHKVLAIVSVIFLVGCSTDKKQQQETSCWDSRTDTTIDGKVIVQIDATDKTSLFEKVKGENRFDGKEKQLIINEFKSSDYTCYRVKKIDSNGKTFLYTYGDCFSNPNAGFGHSTLYECQKGEWRAVESRLYD